MRSTVFGILVVTALSVAASAQQKTADMRMVDAGFKVRLATTPRQIESLRKIPPKRFVARTKNNVRYYLYSDPDDCKCVFLGNQQAMNTYRDMVSPPQGVPMTQPSGQPSMQNILIEEMNEDLGPDDMLDFEM